MSLFGSLFTGVSALSAQSQSMGMISNNIANVNTVGYKREVAAFASLVTDNGRSSVFSPGGVRAENAATVNQQGILQQSSSTTDVGISGSGFFVVRRSPDTTSEPLYTRAGSFSEDSKGVLRNTAGFYLMGWKLDSNGNVPNNNADISSLEPVDVAFLNGLAAPTTTMTAGINLDSTTATGNTFQRTVTVYDSLGGAHEMTLDFTKQAATNTWQLDVNIADAAYTSTAVIEFDGSGAIASIDGNPVDPAQPLSSQLNLTNIDWTDAVSGAGNQDIVLDIKDFTQFASDFNVAYVQQNGAELGLRTGVSIDRNGIVIASFSNGQTKALYKLPLATFASPNGLSAESGNVFRQTEESGDYNLREPGKGGSGLISPSSLEASNVDLADEFSRMIITQRAYSAGTKVISTSDSMLQELLQLR